MIMFWEYDKMKYDKEIEIFRYDKTQYDKDFVTTLRISKYFCSWLSGTEEVSKPTY